MARAPPTIALTRAIPNAETPKVLARLVHQVAGFETADLLAAKLGCATAEVQPWLDGTFAFDIKRAGRIAEVLQLDVPMSVDKALEVRLRSGEGGRS